MIGWHRGSKEVLLTGVERMCPLRVTLMRGSRRSMSREQNVRVQLPLMYIST